MNWILILITLLSVLEALHGVLPGPRQRIQTAQPTTIVHLRTKELVTCTVYECLLHTPGMCSAHHFIILEHVLCYCCTPKIVCYNYVLWAFYQSVELEHPKIIIRTPNFFIVCVLTFLFSCCGSRVLACCTHNPALSNDPPSSIYTA